MYRTNVIAVKIGFVALAISLGATSVLALDLKSFAKKLSGSRWTSSIQTQHTHLSFVYKFSKKNTKGGVFITSINGKLSQFPFASYEVGKLTSVDLEEVIDENDLAIKPKDISGVILVKNAKAELISLLFIMSERCILDTVNVGESEVENCLRL